MDYISSQLKQYKRQTQLQSKMLQEFAHQSPLVRTQQEIRFQLAEAEKYRAGILKNITTFAGLSHEALTSAAQCMEEVFYSRGEHIIEQDDIGDDFYFIEQGRVSVTRKVNSRDPQEQAKELNQLVSGAHFGEISLLTTEPRSATVTVISDSAKCLRMTKLRFDQLLSTTHSLLEQNRKIIGRDVLDAVPLFKSLTAMNKKKLLDVMVPAGYLPESYICRQGTAGNTFYILTEGTCRVTIIGDKQKEVEVARLRPGDFFGEIALIEMSNKRTANVISVDNVSCLTLNRTDFNRLLRSLKVKLLEQQVLRNNQVAVKVNSKNSQMLAKKRRISGYDNHGRRDENRICNLLKRFTRFLTESMWLNMYSRMYKEMLLVPQRAHDYGELAIDIMKRCTDRDAAVAEIRNQAVKALEMDPMRRSPVDHSFVHGLLRQRNSLKEKLCRNWPAHQYFTLCKKIRLMRIKPFRKIIEVDSRGTNAFLILRGSVRIFSRISSDSDKNNLFYEEDLCSGEMFGENALNGMHTRNITAQALTAVELAVIDDQDFMLAQDRDSRSMGIDDRVKFLSRIGLFKNWDSYKILRLAHALVQEEIHKNTVVVTHRKVNKDLYLIIDGRVDVLSSLKKRYVLTSLLKGDYFGESGAINKHTKQANQKVAEYFYAVAVTRIDVLVLTESNCHLLDDSIMSVIRSNFNAKVSWRKDRVVQSKHERAKVRKHKKTLLHSEPLDYDQTKATESATGQYTVLVPLDALAPTYFNHKGDDPAVISSTLQDELRKEFDAFFVDSNNNSPTSPIQHGQSGVSGFMNYFLDNNSTNSQQQRVLVSSGDMDTDADAEGNMPRKLADMTQASTIRWSNALPNAQQADKFTMNGTLPRPKSSGTMTVAAQSMQQKLAFYSRNLGKVQLPDNGQTFSMIRTNHSSVDHSYIGFVGNPSPTKSVLRANLDHNKTITTTTSSNNNNSDGFDHTKSRSNSFSGFRSPKLLSAKSRDQLNDLEDIPEIFSGLYDPLMVIAESKGTREMKAIESTYKYGCMPKIARVLSNSSAALKEPGISTMPVLERPKTAPSMEILSGSGSRKNTPKYRRPQQFGYLKCPSDEHADLTKVVSNLHTSSSYHAVDSPVSMTIDVDAYVGVGPHNGNETTPQELDSPTVVQMRASLENPAKRPALVVSTDSTNIKPTTEIGGNTTKADEEEKAVSIDFSKFNSQGGTVLLGTTCIPSPKSFQQDAAEARPSTAGRNVHKKTLQTVSTTLVAVGKGKSAVRMLKKK